MNWMHQTEFTPTAQHLLDAFSDEITTAGGTVSDVFEADHQVIAKAILPVSAEIRIGDRMNAGVAIRATETEIVVHPYTFREVCSNGSIMVQMLQSRSFVRLQSGNIAVPSYESTVILDDVRDAVRACAAPETFASIENDLRLATQTDGMMLVHLLHQLRRSMEARDFLESYMRIQDRYREDADPSAFGLMNAVTSVARDTGDPVARWNLESVGGRVPAFVRRQARLSRNTTPSTATEHATSVR